MPIGISASILIVFGVSFIFSRRVLGYYCLLGHEHFLPRRFQFPVIQYFEGMYSELTDISKSYTTFSWYCALILLFLKRHRIVSYFYALLLHICVWPLVYGTHKFGHFLSAPLSPRLLWLSDLSTSALWEKILCVQSWCQPVWSRKGNITSTSLVSAWCT